MSKIEQRLKARKKRLKQQPHFTPVDPIEVTEKVKIVEFDLISNAYFNPDVEEEEFNIEENEIQFMIDSLTEQRNDFATKAAAYKARIKLYHSAVIERNRLLQQKDVYISDLENQIKGLKMEIDCYNDHTVSNIQD